MDSCTYFDTDDEDEEAAMDDLDLFAVLWCYYYQVRGLPRWLHHRQRLYSGNGLLHQLSVDRRTTSMTSASSRKRKWSDPMSSSAHFWEGFRKVYEEISLSKKQNHRCSASKKAEDDAEYEAFMRELLDAGVNPVSQEYFMASEVLVDVTRRGAYRPLPSIDAKLAWIKAIYLMTKGQPPSV